MPQGRQLTAAEQIAQLQAQVKRKDEELARKNEELAEERAKNHSDKVRLIPRPRGQAGRSAKGYVLQEEMGLKHESEHYQRLMPSKSKQSGDEDLEEGSDDDEEGDIDAEEGDDDNEGEGDDGDLEVEQKDVEEEGEEVAYVEGYEDMPMDQDFEPQDLVAEEVDPSTPTLYSAEWDMEVEKVDKENRPPSSDKPKRVKKTDAPASIPAKRQAPKSEVDGRAQLKKKTKFNHTVHEESPEPSENARPLRSLDRPTHCPGPKCHDAVPEYPSETLLKLFSNRRVKIAKEGNKSPAVLAINREICSELSQEIRCNAILEEGDSQGWPAEVDFHYLADRTEGLANEIVSLAVDGTALAESPIWLEFLRCIGYKFFAFRAASYGSFSDEAELKRRCGYLGPRGRTTITSVIDKMVARSVTDYQQIWDTIGNLMNTPSKWDKFNNEWIESYAFIDHVLVPHAAAALIAQDLDIDIADAAEILWASSDFGDLTQPSYRDRPGPRLIFNVVQANAIEVSQPTKLKPSKAASKVCSCGYHYIPGSIQSPQKPLAIPKVKETTLADFAPPTLSKSAKNKKSKGLKPEETVAKHRYGTRAKKEDAGSA
ncbi:hypothetical protein FB45DRAFT_1004856 [Roridomyces roridus]|uniref:Restriction of telomere capping protein 4 C-terminal domain-containing protein n=1 Tax=Roridomyces roridus TaxID=1738132 RepID=A0AAD7BQE9_9AGAR|nr:hypothetical protein FB45DRAFT_1004856 [Roridomyces roridus]